MISVKKKKENMRKFFDYGIYGRDPAERAILKAKGLIMGMERPCKGYAVIEIQRNTLKGLKEMGLMQGAVFVRATRD